MNYSYAFKFVTEDKDWISKILITGLISLIPIVGWVYLSGWKLEVTRRVIARREDVLPDTQFSQFLSLGFKSWVVALVYAIPLFLISGFNWFVSFVGDKILSGDVASVFIGGLSCVGGLVFLIFFVAIGLILLPALLRVAKYDTIKEGLNIAAVFKTLKNNIGLFALILILYYLLWLISGSGLIVCIIGIIFTLPYTIAVMGHLLGQTELQCKS